MGEAGAISPASQTQADAAHLGGPLCAVLPFFGAAMHRVLIVYDVPGWAYWRRAVALQKNAPDDFEVEIAESRDATRNVRLLADVQLIYNLDYMTQGYKRLIRQYGLDTKLVISHNRDSKSRLENWKDSYGPSDYLVCNNREVWDYHGHLTATCNISNGWDADIWGCETPITDRPKQVFWTGSENPKKAKGWHNILRPMIPVLQERGYEPLFRGFPTGGNLQEWAWDTDKMRETYNSSFAVICASEHEGTPNFSLEGMACGCCLVTTPVGNVLEFGNGINAVICERTIESLVEGVEQAWEHREALSLAARETMESWRYDGPDGRAQWYFAMFRKMIAGGPKPTPFSYMDTHWSDV